MVCSRLSYSCLLLRMCNAYAETGIFVLIYHICSQYLIAIDLPVWHTYDLLHVLYCNLYIPLESVLFCGDLSSSWLYMVLHVRNAMFRSVPLNMLITWCLSGLWYVNVIISFFVLVWEYFLPLVFWLFCSLNCRWSVMENHYS